MNKKLLTVVLGIALLATTVTGCSYSVEREYIPVDTETDTLLSDSTESDDSVELPNLTQTLPVKDEDFSLVVTYDTGNYPLKSWHVTDAKSVNMDVHTKDLPEGYDVLVEHMHADISLVSTSPQINGITQDSMDNSFHGNSQDGFVIDDKTSYYRTFSIEGYTDQFYQLWGYAFGNYGNINTSYKRLTEKNILAVGTYAERLTIVYDLAIKATGDEKYHGTSIKSTVLIPISKDIHTKTVDIFDE